MIAVFAEDKGFAAQAGERIEQANGIAGIVVVMILLEGTQEIGEANFDHAFLETGVGRVLANGEDIIAEAMHVAAPLAVGEILLFAVRKILIPENL